MPLVTLHASWFSHSQTVQDGRGNIGCLVHFPWEHLFSSVHLRGSVCISESQACFSRKQFFAFHCKHCCKMHYAYMDRQGVSNISRFLHFDHTYTEVSPIAVYTHRYTSNQSLPESNCIDRYQADMLFGKPLIPEPCLVKR